MTTEIKKDARVRVAVHRNGCHVRNFVGSVIGWTPNGLIKVLEDGKDKARTYSSDHVKLIRA
ncbi:hypothetical protein [Spirosoma fluminis]